MSIKIHNVHLRYYSDDMSNKSSFWLSSPNFTYLKVTDISI